MPGSTKTQRMQYTEKAQSIVESLTLEEKVSLMSGTMTFEEVRGAIKKRTQEHYNQFPYPAGGIAKKHVSPVLFVDGPRGVVCGNGKSTAFPVSMLRGATFDTELEERIGEAIGEEVLAYGGNLFGGVCINLPYNPGWGRSQETYGEDSFQLGEMGAALVRGVQKKGVMACVKHFAFNQMENARFTVDITADKRTEREVFLPHFKKAVDAGAACVMSAYNSYQGKICGHNEYLLNQILKKEWDFDGFIMSDFVWGVKDTVESVNGGQTMEMPNTKYFGENLVKAVKAGKVSESVIDDAALRIVRTVLAFTDGQSKADRRKVGCREHVELALEAAREGITLIKNNENVLPLNKKDTHKLLVLGRLANKENTGDRGTSQVYPKHVVTILEGLIKNCPDTEVIYYPGKNIEHSKKMAREADAVIFVAGYDYRDEGEFVAQDKEDVFTGGVGGDRRNGLSIHSEEQELITEVGPENIRSAVVLIGGNTIMLDSWSDKVNAILFGYYPGMKGGQAVAEILFGDINPGGKLPFTIPQKEEHLTEIDWNTEHQKYDYFHGYRKLEKENHIPAVPFGFGLSYTQFEVEKPQVWKEKDQICVCAEIKNSGHRAGSEVLQLYVGFKNSKIKRDIKALKGFKRVWLEPGERRIVTISCPIEELKWYNENTGEFELEHMNYEIYIGTSSADKDLCKTSIDV